MPQRLTAPVFVVAAGGADPAADTLVAALGLASATWVAHEPFLGGGDLHDALLAALTDREGRSAADAGDEPLHAVAGGRDVIDAVPQLAAAFPDARFVVVGADGAAAPEGLAAVAPKRVLRADADRLLLDPRAELQRICTFAGIAYDQALLTPLEHAHRQSGAGATDAAALGSEATTTFAAALDSALLISTYQTGKLVLARRQADGGINTHFKSFDKPMGIAVAPGRVALGTRSEVWDFRDMPEAAAKIDPPGSHDACFLPRNRHVTGDIAVHDLAFAGGELWIVATAFSCLATLDANHSFVPRWVPRFITELASEDRCHLNGLAVAGDRPTYVTALGTTNEPRGWTERKADGGVVIDLASSEIAIGGLSMPHSPRWYDNRLWLLESGRGTLCVADLAAGSVETVVELPGFTRGLAFSGRTAFVGLSQIRESATFGDLPLVGRLQERQSGVWMVDLPTGTVTGFLRFDDLVQEIFDVALLPGVRFPELAEPGDERTLQSYVLP